MFKRVLIANRGEIAVRVMRTLREMGIESVAVFSDADSQALHVREADASVRIGPAPAIESYLDIQAVIEAAVSTGADAIHPGYGFLSENADFARACAEAGIVFIGPPVSAIESMGDKISAKNKVAAAGVPVVPGSHEAGMTDDQVASAVAAIGFPALLKPSAGGGGKGMRIVRAGDDVAEAVAAARREAARSFGDETLLVERLVENPRHIEVQVLADNYGHVVHLGERECSLQRRHQKVVEEAPSPFVDGRMRAEMGQSAVDVARSCGYSGVGTVEFIVSGSSREDYYFLEMNTRLQVEHPVTEMVTGVDLVREQLRVAAGEELALKQSDIELRGHAIEARVYAEDPAAGFLPSVGELLLVAEPGQLNPVAGTDPSKTGSSGGALPFAGLGSGLGSGPGPGIGRGPAAGIRVDSGVETADVVGTHYDPMLSKIIGFADTRGQALDRLDSALAQTAYLGVSTNVGYLRDILADTRVVAGQLHTGLLAEIRVSGLFDSRDSADFSSSSNSDGIGAARMALSAAALEKMVWLAEGNHTGSRLGRCPAVGEPWDTLDGWRLGEPVWITTLMKPAFGEAIEVSTQGTPNDAQVRVGADEPSEATVRVDGSRLVIQVAGQRSEFWFAKRGDELWLATGGRSAAVHEIDQLEADRSSEAAAGLGPVQSPMPGTVIAVHVVPDERVAQGSPLVTVEAMKMEHSLAAEGEAQVVEILVEVGQQVSMGEDLVTLEPVELSEAPALVELPAPVDPPDPPERTGGSR